MEVRLVFFEQEKSLALHRWLFDRVERRKHPRNRARPGLGIRRQKTRVVLGDVKHDRTRFKKNEVALMIRRNLMKGLKPGIALRLHIFEGDEPHVVRLPDLLEGPAHPHISGKPSASIG